MRRRKRQPHPPAPPPTEAPPTEAPTAVPPTLTEVPPTQEVQAQPKILRVAATASVTTWDPSASSSTEALYMANIYEPLIWEGRNYDYWVDLFLGWDRGPLEDIVAWPAYGWQQCPCLSRRQSWLQA